MVECAIATRFPVGVVTRSISSWTSFKSCSRTTIPNTEVPAETLPVRTAIGELTEEGYLYAEHGRGTFVSKRTIHTRTSKNIAVVCYNDQVAVEVIRTLREFGKKVPRDVSVTGFDNSLLAKNNHIPITTISHPQDKLGSMAAELLLRLILGEELTEQELHIRVEPEIVVRDSTWKR